VDRPADSLPNDIDALRALALNAIAERAPAIAERDRLIAMNEKLRQLLRKAQGFEAKSERLAKLHPDQLNLALEDIEQTLAKAAAIEEKTQAAAAPRKRRINRGALPAHLPRIRERVAPADTNCPCCQQPMHVIGEETSERLDVIPAQYRVIVTHRPRFACRACERIVEAPAPEHLIKSGLPTEAMVTSVLVAKYGWHLPLYRQAKMLAAQGLDLDRHAVDRLRSRQYGRSRHDHQRNSALTAAVSANKIVSARCRSTATAADRNAWEQLSPARPASVPSSD
jgi:transposase